MAIVATPLGAAAVDGNFGASGTTNNIATGVTLGTGDILIFVHGDSSNPDVTGGTIGGVTLTPIGNTTNKQGWAYIATGVNTATGNISLTHNFGFNLEAANWFLITGEISPTFTFASNESFNSSDPQAVSGTIPSGGVGLLAIGVNGIVGSNRNPTTWVGCATSGNTTLEGFVGTGNGIGIAGNYSLTAGTGPFTASGAATYSLSNTEIMMVTFSATGGGAVADILGMPQGTIFVPGGRRASGPARGLSRVKAFPERKTTAQTVTVTSTSTVTQTKSVGKLIAATCTSAVTLLKSIAKSIAVTCATTVTTSQNAFTAGVQEGMRQGFLFKPGKGPAWDLKRRQAFPPPSLVTQFNQTVTVNATSTVSMVKSTAHIIGVVCGATVSLVKSTGKSIAATCTSTVTLLKSIGKVIAVTCTTTTTLSALKVKLVTITVACTTTVAAVSKAVSKVITVTVATTVTRTKAIAKGVTVACASAVTMTKAIAKTIAVICASLVSIVAQKLGLANQLRGVTVTITVAAVDVQITG